MLKKLVIAVASLGVAAAQGAQPFTRIVEFSYSGSAWCAIDEMKGVICHGWFGNGEPQEIEVPAMVRPRLLKTTYEFACAADDAGVHCWGLLPKEIPAFTPLLGVRGLAVASGRFCAIAEGRVHCSGAAFWSQEMPRDLKAPTSVAAAGGQICVVDQGEIRCWGVSGGTDPRAPTRFILKNPEVFASGSGFCVKDEITIRCWGSRSPMSGQAFMKDGLPKVFNGACGVAPSGAVTCIDTWAARDQGKRFAPLGPGIVEAAGSTEYGACAHNGTQVYCTGSRSAQVATPTQDVQDYSPSGALCTLDREGSGAVAVKCFEGNPGETGNPPLQGWGLPTAIAGDGFNTCLVTADRVRCWGGGEDLAPEGLNAPQAVAVLSDGRGALGACALEGADVVCRWRAHWGKALQSRVPGVSDARSLASGKDTLCVAGPNRVACFKFAEGEQPKPWLAWTDLEGARDLRIWSSLGETYLTAVTDRGLLLRGLDRTDRKDLWAVGATSGVFGGTSHYDPIACYRKGGGPLQCEAGGQALAVPEFKDPARIRADGSGRFCAVDEGRLVCWRYSGALKLDRIKRY